MASRPGLASHLSACLYSAYSSSPNPSRRMHSYVARNAPGAFLRTLRHHSSVLWTPACDPPSGALLHDSSSRRLLSCRGAPRFLVLKGPFHGGPLLVPLEQRVQFLRRLQAQRDRDQNRAQRLDPPISEDGTVSFASKVLELSCLPQGSRSHYEKLLHERHWPVGHNSSKEATTSLERQTLLTCSLCSSPDRRADDTYDHVFRLHPLLHQCRTDLNR